MLTLLRQLWPRRREGEKRRRRRKGRRGKEKTEVVILPPHTYLLVLAVEQKLPREEVE